MRTIGVIGGFGPQATMEFQARVHAIAQRRIPPDGIRGYPPMIVYYHRNLPVAVKPDGSPEKPFRVSPDLLRGIAIFKGRADFICITANAPHLFQREIEAAAGCPALSMIQTTLDEVERRAWKRVGVLGFLDPRTLVYSDPMQSRGLHMEFIEPSLQPRLDAAIRLLAEGRENDESRATALEAVRSLRARRVDGIILGCTEIPPLLDPAPDLLSPLEHLAECAVERALN